MSTKTEVLLGIRAMLQVLLLCFVAMIVLAFIVRGVTGIEYAAPIMKWVESPISELKIWQLFLIVLIVG